MRSCFARNDPPRFLPGAVVAKLGRLKDGEAGRPDVCSGFEAKQFRYYGFAFTLMASGFGGTTNVKEDRGVKRPAIGVNAHVGRSPGRLYANPLGPQRRIGSLKNEKTSFPDTLI